MIGLSGLMVGLAAFFYAPSVFTRLAQPLPPLTDLGTLPGGMNCRGIAVNNSCTVVGVCDDAAGHTVAFRKPQGGAFQSLATIAPGKSCSANDINNSGAVSGTCEDANGEYRPVRWQPDGTLQILNPRLVVLLSDVSASGGPINQSGAIAGSSMDGGGKSRGVVWMPGQTTPEELPMTGLLNIGALNCSANELNDEAPGANGGPVVTGTCAVQEGETEREVAVRWQRNALGIYFITALPPIIANGNCYGQDINGAPRQVAGTCTDQNGDLQAVRWTGAPPVVESIEASAPAGTAQSSVASINASGLIAGTYITPDKRITHAYLWNPDNNNFFDIPPLPGGFRNWAIDLNNDNNTVVGISQISCCSEHAFRWRLATGTQDLGVLPGGCKSAAADIGDQGCITGWSQVPAGNRHAFFVDPP